MTPGRRITFKRLAELAGVHWHTLWFYLKQHGVYERFSSISDVDLDILVKTFKTQKACIWSYLCDWLFAIAWLMSSEAESSIGIAAC
jgi:hypothetical protein